MLFLILSYRYFFRLIHKHVGSHQDRIRKQSVACCNSFCDLVLIGMATLQESHRGQS